MLDLEKNVQVGASVFRLASGQTRLSIKGAERGLRVTRYDRVRGTTGRG